MFKKLSLAKKLIFGFSTVILLLVVISLLSYRTIHDASVNFKTYRGLARDTNLAGRVQVNMLMVQMNVKDFIITGSKKDIDQYSQYVTKTDGFLRIAKNEIQKPERAIKIEQIYNTFREYKEKFKLVIKARKERDDLVLNKLNVNGKGMENTLTEMLALAKNDQNTSILYFISLSLEHLLLARLYEARFLDDNKKSNSNRVVKELSKMEVNLNLLDKKLQNKQNRKWLSDIRKMKEVYLTSKTKVSDIIFARNNVISNHLDKMGPEISAAIEFVQLSVKKEQNKLGSIVESENQRGITVIILIALIAVVIGVLITGVIIKGILFQLGGDPSIVLDAAQKIAKGDLTTNIEIGDNTTSLLAAMKTMIGSLKAISEEVEGITNSAIAGKLDVRADVSKHKGDFAEIVIGINGTLDALIFPLNTAGKYIELISKGDIPEQITEEYQGDFNALKNNLNQLITSTNQITIVAESISIGELDIEIKERSEKDKLMQALKRMVESLNSITVVAESISIGELDIEVKERSEKDKLMQALKRMIDSLNSVSEEVEGTTKSAIAGKLNVRADVSKHKGDFAKIVIGINGTLDALIFPLNTARKYIELISKGDIPEQITEEYQGDFNALKNNLNQLITSTNQITIVAESISIGELDIEVKERSEKDKLMQALKVMIGSLNSITMVAESISIGELDIEVKDRSEKDKLMQALKRMIDSLNAVSEEVEGTTKSAIAGKLDIRADVSKHKGDFAKIVTGINQTLDALIFPLNTAGKYIELISKGEIPKPIREEYQGDFNSLKDNLNQLIETSSEITEIAEKIAEGDLRVNIKERSHNDKLLLAMKSMVLGLREIASQVKEASNNIAFGSRELSSASGQLAEGSSEQAASAEQVSSSMEQMVSNIEQNSDNANQTETIA
ncbi:MAG: methyl-accepting chemotaxis protein, partial [bacterium]